MSRFTAGLWQVPFLVASDAAGEQFAGAWKQYSRGSNPVNNKEYRKMSLQLTFEKLADVRGEIRDLTQSVEAINAKAKGEFSEGEKQQIDAMLSQLSDKRAEADRLEGITANLQAMESRKMESLQQSRLGTEGRATVENGSRWETSDGKILRVVNRGEKLATTNNSGLSFGNAVVAKLTGNTRMLRELKNAQYETIDSGGGFLVPGPLVAGVIDLARANSALVQAGVPFIEMPSETITLAKVKTDPTFATKSEGSSLSESQITFGNVQFISRLVGCYVKASRELLEDAPNAAALIESTLSRALAVEIDRMGVVGDGSQEEVGLLNATGITETTSVGAIEWADVHNAATTVRGNNYEPTGYVCHPTIAGDLDLLTASGSGTWLGAPPSLSNVPRYTTTNCPTSGLVVGDFARGCAFGVRTQALVEMTNTGGDSFKNHETWIKITVRACFRTLVPAAFARLAGITT